MGGEREEGHLEICPGRAPLLSFTSADDHLAQQPTTRSPNIVDSSLLIPTAYESYWFILFRIVSSWSQRSIYFQDLNYIILAAISEVIAMAEIRQCYNTRYKVVTVNASGTQRQPIDPKRLSVGFEDLERD